VVKNSLKVTHIKGSVFSGSGDGAKFVELPWAKKQITKKFGFVPYLGTLNIRITGQSLRLKSLLEKLAWIEILPVNGFCRGRLADAYFIDNLKCAIIIPEVENYPDDVLELIAPINLRQKFKLEDGDVVEVKIMLP
jgi:riboflavin kinase